MPTMSAANADLRGAQLTVTEDHRQHMKNCRTILRPVARLVTSGALNAPPNLLGYVALQPSFFAISSCFAFT